MKADESRQVTVECRAKIMACQYSHAQDGKPTDQRLPSDNRPEQWLETIYSCECDGHGRPVPDELQHIHVVSSAKIMACKHCRPKHEGPMMLLLMAEDERDVVWQ